MSGINPELLLTPGLGEWLQGDASRDSTIAFIRHYHRRIKDGEDIPAWWHHRAADILSRAADAVEADPSKATGPVAKAMGLQAGRAHERRNEAICIAIQQLKNKGMSTDKAQEIVADRVFLTPGNINRKIWRSRNKEYIKWSAAEDPDADFLALRYPTKK